MKTKWLRCEREQVQLNALETEMAKYLQELGYLAQGDVE